MQRIQNRNSWSRYVDEQSLTPLTFHSLRIPHHLPHGYPEPTVWIRTPAPVQDSTESLKATGASRSSPEEELKGRSLQHPSRESSKVGATAASKD